MLTLSPTDLSCREVEMLNYLERKLGKWMSEWLTDLSPCIRIRIAYFTTRHFVLFRHTSVTPT